MKRNLVLLFFIVVATNVYASDYPDTIDIPLNHLDISEEQMLAAAGEGLKHYGWQVEEESAKSLIGNLQGEGESRVRVQFSADKILLSYLTDEDMTQYKYYRRLLSIRTSLYKSLLECTSPIYKRNPPQSDKVFHLRAAVYAIASYSWDISKLSENEIVSSLPARGRMEALIDENGARFRHWDELEEAYASKGDNYTRRVQRAYRTQLRLCPR